MGLRKDKLKLRVTPSTAVTQVTQRTIELRYALASTVLQGSWQALLP